MRARRIKNFIFISLVVCLAGIALIPLFSVLYYVIAHGISSLSIQFFTQLPAPVGETGGGIGHAILGSIILIVMASLISIPLGLGMGILLSEYKQMKITRWLGVSVELLSSIPSIVIGLFAYAILVKPFHGFSAHAGAIALAMVMIPIIARTTEEMLKLVPQSVREAGLALGLPKYRMILRIVVQGSMSSIMVGLILAIARIAGETAPLLFTAFASSQWFQGLNQPIASIPVQIYTYAVSPYEDWHNKAWGGALILILMILTLNLFIRVFLSKKKVR
ncbi:MAG: phosphate ABC transporter permease PstA [Bdellovibrionales bacterium]|nr:phosphate ABC transporter permease PstA [Oligoflexia bacterium]